MDQPSQPGSNNEGEFCKNLEDIKEKLNSHLKRRMQENTHQRKSAEPVTSNKVKRSKKIDRSASVDNQEPEDTVIEAHDGPQDNKREPDILSEILNEKKLSLMQDPSVTEFLRKLYTKR
ncbi:uncharacterized protein LOC113385183 [Ctenocephalides felis]|uniref:uncharacterized protein LOC113385183 n=1 Tax=Ctenocephalides felis TaxID=7515 RepID=UPI000E6E2CFE|nr:uncharacterized protein LOC113385183 [Ctenocephalides felis]